jgi:tryptophan halogenase
LYAKFLRKFSAGFGVKRVEGKIGQVLTDAATGHVAGLKLENGALIEGDLFIDCTGFRSLLLGAAMGVEYDDWSHWLFNDSAIAVQTELVGEPVPLTRSIAHGAGWQWRIPLQHRVGNGHVFSSKHMDGEQAKQILINNIQGAPLTQPRVIKFTPGQRRQSWKGNVIAVGLSSGFLEPIESTSIHLIQRNLIRLMQMFPADGICRSDIDEYNAQVQSEIRHIRDFIILHYKVTKRSDTHRPVPRNGAGVSHRGRVVYRIVVAAGHAGPGIDARAASSDGRPDGRRRAVAVPGRDTQRD